MLLKVMSVWMSPPLFSPWKEKEHFKLLRSLVGLRHCNSIFRQEIEKQMEFEHGTRKCTENTRYKCMLWGKKKNLFYLQVLKACPTPFSGPPQQFVTHTHIQSHPWSIWFLCFLLIITNWNKYNDKTLTR